MSHIEKLNHELQEAIDNDWLHKAVRLMGDLDRLKMANNGEEN